MNEKTALSCTRCDWAAIHRTPDHHEALRELIKELNPCKGCGRLGTVIQRAYYNGTFNSCSA